MFCPLDDPSPLPETYLRSAPPSPSAPPLSGEAKADIAIVGGGYTGLSAALHLAEQGRSVVLLEARTIGSGGSGRAFGQVVPYAKHDHAHILAHFGPEAGSRIVDALGAGPEFVWSLIERHGIACEASRQGLLFAAHTRSARAGLEARASFWQKRGAAVEMLDAAATRQATGSDYYAVALLDRRGGHLNPLAYARGLAIAAARHGVALHENSRALGLAPEGDGWRIRTERGSVLARAVVVGTGAYSDDLVPRLRRSFVPMRAHQLVTRPLSDNLRKSVLPADQPITDTRRLYSGMRLLSDGRVHMSVDGPAFSRTGSVFMAKAAARLRAVFPQIGEPEWDETWTGWVDMTADQYPHIHEIGPGAWAIIGLSGRGIAFATLLGREIALRLAGRPENELFLPVTALKPIAVRPFAAPLVGALMTSYRIWDRLELRSRPRATGSG